MRKVLVVMAVLALAVSSVLAETKIDQAKKAREESLQVLAAEISVYLNQIAEDQIVKAEEMKKLSQLVDRFKKEREEAEKVYGEISVNLDPDIQKVVKLYEKPSLRDGAYKTHQIKNLLASLTGKDIIEIEESFDYAVLAVYLFFVIMSVVFLRTRFATCKSLWIIMMGFYLVSIILGLLGV